MQTAPPGKSGKPSRRIRLDDLATACGVSIATVSRALSGAPGVRPELVEKIQRKAQEFRYALPSTLAGQRLLILASPAAMEDYARSQFTLNVMQGIEERVRLLRAELVTQAITSTAQERQTLAEAATDPRVAGLLFLTLDDEDMLTAARNFRKPVVLVNGDDPLMQLSSVAPSNRAAAAMATDYLMRLGHRRILFLSHRGRRTIERRVDGWRDRMTAGGTVLDLSLQMDVPDWLPDRAADALCARVSTRGIDFTAVLCASDSLALGAIQGLGALGLSVPGDVSVLGMDGLAQGAFFTPALTALEIPMQHIGATAVDLVRDLSLGAHMPARRIELACRLVERASCGPVPSRA